MTTRVAKNVGASAAAGGRTFVVGTAGHVDHGKSSLVRALTGIDPDRLREEREREMTIDLGFAWLELPNGATVSVVDVPGHERFIKNMLAGVGGIDAAILVVAADEGPMPQTAEHLAILDLLEIERGVVALSKRDLVDVEWLDLIAEETRERLAGTSLADAPIIPVSATTGVGLDDLLEALGRVLGSIPERSMSGRPRLPVDRAFSVAGFGTVVTGTLVDGTLEVGQEVELQPSGIRSRVRGLQSHGRKVERAVPGARTAVNLSGVEREAVQRGHVLTTSGWLRATTLLDVRLRLAHDAPHPVEQNDAVDVFIGAAESSGHVTLLDADRLLPGEAGWAQLRLNAPIVAAAGDRYIVRQPSPSMTIGGGTVVDPHPRRHRRFRGDVIRALETRATGTLEDRALQLLDGGARDLRELATGLDVTLDDARSAISNLHGSGDTILLGLPAAGPIPPNRLVMRSDAFMRLRERLIGVVTEYHDRQPLRRGVPREDVRSRLDLTPRAFDALVQTLVAGGALADLGSLIAVTGREISLSDRQREAANRFVAALAAQPNSPPSPGEYGVDPDLLAAMADLGWIVRLPDNIVFGTDQLAAIQSETLRLIDERGKITLAEFRDNFASSRKYAQAVLEYFDQKRVTRRVGDARVRGSG